jgi:putative transcriptional regulator
MKRGLPKIEKGILIMKSPEIDPTNFDRSVYLICEHNENASLGLRLDLPFTDHLPMGAEELDPITIRRFGGNTQKKEIFLLHTNPGSKGLELAPNLFLGGEPDIYKEVALVVGYTLWTAGKLVEEFLQGHWYVTQMDKKYLFLTPPEQIWHKAVKDLGGKYSFICHFPKELNLN